jgi:hypothetical protein
MYFFGMENIWYTSVSDEQHGFVTGSNNYSRGWGEPGKDEPESIKWFGSLYKTSRNSYLFSKLQGGSRKKILPRVEFFISAILAGLTLLCNQAHTYIRKYDITDLGLSPDVLQAVKTLFS